MERQGGCLAGKRCVAGAGGAGCRACCHRCAGLTAPPCANQHHIPRNDAKGVMQYMQQVQAAGLDPDNPLSSYMLQVRRGGVDRGRVCVEGWRGVYGSLCVCSSRWAGAGDRPAWPDPPRRRRRVRASARLWARTFCPTWAW